MTHENLLTRLINSKHDHDWIGAGVSKVMQAFAAEICQLSVSVTYTRTYPEGHGGRSPLSAQGSSEEHDNFHPAHKEYTKEPQAGQC
jgi:hypothetical protein